MLSGKGHPQWLWDRLNELHFVTRDQLRTSLANNAIGRLGLWDKSLEVQQTVAHAAANVAGQDFDQITMLYWSGDE